MGMPNDKFLGLDFVASSSYHFLLAKASVCSSRIVFCHSVFLDQNPALRAVLDSFFSFFSTALQILPDAFAPCRSMRRISAVKQALCRLMASHLSCLLYWGKALSII